MLKWIILSIIFYVIVGFSTCLIVQIHDTNTRDSFDSWCWSFNGHLEPDEYWGKIEEDILGITLLWPMLVLCIILGFVVPKLFVGMYKLFVLIIFSIGALFTKGDKNG